MWFLFWVFFIWFLLTLLISVYRGFKVYRRGRRAFDAMFGNDRNHSAKKKKEAETPAPPRKIIDPEIGEYVHYEEIDVSAETKTENQHTTTKIKVEEQIVDVQWEEIQE